LSSVTIFISESDSDRTERERNKKGRNNRKNNLSTKPFQKLVFTP